MRSNRTSPSGHGIETMIHEAFNKSEIARRYFLAKGETLSKQEAINRWRMVKNVDKKILSNVVREISKEQMTLIKRINGETADN